MPFKVIFNWFLNSLIAFVFHPSAWIVWHLIRHTRCTFALVMKVPPTGNTYGNSICQKHKLCMGTPPRHFRREYVDWLWPSAKLLRQVSLRGQACASTNVGSHILSKKLHYQNINQQRKVQLGIPPLSVSDGATRMAKEAANGLWSQYNYVLQCARNSEEIKRSPNHTASLSDVEFT